MMHGVSKHTEFGLFQDVGLYY